MSQPADALFLTIETAAQSGCYGMNNMPEPTEAQKESGNYRMGRFTLYGLPIAIEQPRHSYRTGKGANGKRWASRMAAHYGYFTGTKGADGDGVDVFVGYYPQAERAYIVNQQWDGKFDEHKVLLAFPDEESARRAYLGSYEKGWKGLGSIVECSISQLKWWLKNADKSRPVFAQNLPYEGMEDMKKIAWDESALPIGATLDRVLYDVRRNDEDGLLMDSVTVAEIMEDADEAVTLDALVVPFVRLERQMTILRNVMERAAGNVKPIAVQTTEPFKQRGTANVAAVFELSDGQTVTIFFHNPDVTPNKIAPGDELVSWKWMLNKKDITIVVAPERGSDLNVREVARRIMALAEKNSAAFQRANARRTERMQTINTLKGEIQTLEGELAKAQSELELAKMQAEERAAQPRQNTGTEAPFMVTRDGNAVIHSADGSEEMGNDWTGVAADGSDAKSFWYIGQDNGERSFHKLSANTYAAAQAEAAAVVANTQQDVQNGGPTPNPEEAYSGKVMSALQALGYEPDGDSVRLDDGDFSVAVSAAHKDGLVEFSISVEKAGVRQHDAQVSADLTSQDTLAPSRMAASIHDEAKRGMADDGEGQAQSDQEPEKEEDRGAPEQMERATDEQIQELAAAGAEVSMISRNLADKSTKDMVPAAYLRRADGQGKSIALIDQADVERARKAVAEAEAQSNFAPYSPSGLRMPTAVQLGLNVRGGLILFTRDGVDGWSNGHLLDFDRPKLVNDAIAKYFVDETSDGIRKLSEDSVGRVVTQAVNTATTEVSPIAEHKGVSLSVTAKKGSQYADLNSIVLVSDDGSFATKLDRKYFAYFEKKYKGPQYLSPRDSAALVVKKDGKVVGVVMPIASRGEEPEVLARRAAQAAQAKQPDSEANTANPIEMVDSAYELNASDEFKQWLADSVNSAQGPFATVKAMTSRAREAGASIEWGFFDGVALDSAEDAAAVSPDQSAMVFDSEPEKQPDPDSAPEPEKKDPKDEKGTLDEAKADDEKDDPPRDDANPDDDAAAALDSASKVVFVGRVAKDGEVVGRIDMDSSGAALVYPGNEGSEPVRSPDGEAAQRSTADAPAMIDWLLTPAEVVPAAAEQAAESDPHADEAKAFLRSIIDGHFSAMDQEIPARLEEIHQKHGEDVDILGLWGQATKKYVADVAKAAGAALSEVA